MEFLIYFKRLFLCTLNDAFQFRVLLGSKKKNNRWITLGQKTTFKGKQGVYVLSKISKCPVIKSYCLHYCGMLRRVIRRAKLLF
jgi:hypothetical protein